MPEKGPRHDHKPAPRLAEHLPYPARTTAGEVTNKARAMVRPGVSTTRGDAHGKCTVGQRTEADRCLLASRQLPLGRPDLSLRQSLAREAPDQGAHQAPAARSLGNHAGLELHL